MMKTRSNLLISGIALITLTTTVQVGARELARGSRTVHGASTSYRGGFSAVRGEGGGGTYRGRHRIQGADGGMARRATGAWQGPQGAGGFTTRSYRSDGRGDAQGGHLHAYQRPNGNTGYRAARFQNNADGSASRQAQAHRETQQGTLDRDSQYTRDAEGNSSYQRTTSLNGVNGNHVEAQVNRSNGELTRSVTCNGGVCPEPTGSK